MEDKSEFKYLFKIDSPEDLKKIDVKDLPEVCDELRKYLIDTITQTGGHFGANLGAVELTAALHYVYDAPKDKIIWDVGHQGYPHKVLTGRRDLLPTIRQKGGLSGFLKIDESPYDAYGAGHASTSVSAALGMAIARDILKEDYRVVAVIGDGALTGGIAYEALNNCGVLKKDITVVLNDNNMSISKNISAISNYFNELFASPIVEKTRENIWELTHKIDSFGDRIRTALGRIEGGIKTIVTPGSLFEAFGFKYFGPLSGHNVRQLVRMFRLVKDMKGPVLIHVITEKGKGYEPAEKDPQKLHAIGKINSKASTGKKPSPKKYSRVFGEAVVEIVERNPKVVGITAAMAEGTGLDLLREKFPDRFFDVGIAEQHAATFAAGMAVRGLKPIVAIYSTFLQRSYDQIIHDCALQKLPVVFALDRAGIVGEDGPTHHGVLDLAYMRSIPNMTVMAPKDENELRDMLYTAVYFIDSPSSIRFPRGASFGLESKAFEQIPIGKSETLKEGSKGVIFAIGSMVYPSLKAAEELEKEGLSIEVINARFVKPLDKEAVKRAVEKFDKIMTVEEGQIQGGFGQRIYF